MTEAAFWWVHQDTAKPYQGTGAYGPVYGDPVPVECWIEDVVKLVNDSKGQEVVSTTTVMGPLDKADTHVPNSEITLPSGRVAHVISLARHDSGSLDLEIDHFEAYLT